MPIRHPDIVVIGGSNGAGKTTISRPVLADTLGLTNFVNADTIAQGLSGFDPERAAFHAGRVMLARLRDLAAARADSAFETTLARRSFAPRLAGLRRTGSRVSLIDAFLNSSSLVVRRVQARVRRGGHAVAPDWSNADTTEASPTRSTSPSPSPTHGALTRTPTPPPHARPLQVSPMPPR